MKKYANYIALLIATVSSGAMLYFAWPILTDPTLGDFDWMILSIIGLIFVVYYMLLSDILKWALK